MRKRNAVLFGAIAVVLAAFVLRPVYAPADSRLGQGWAPFIPTGEWHVNVERRDELWVGDSMVSEMLGAVDLVSCPGAPVDAVYGAARTALMPYDDHEWELVVIWTGTAGRVLFRQAPEQVAARITDTVKLLGPQADEIVVLLPNDDASAEVEAALPDGLPARVIPTHEWIANHGTTDGLHLDRAGVRALAADLIYSKNT